MCHEHQERIDIKAEIGEIKRKRRHLKREERKRKKQGFRTQIFLPTLFT